MKQTAVDWLAEQITTVKWKMSDVTDRNSIIEQAKAMEKEQIIQTYHKAALNEATYIVAGTSHISAEQYYNETFKSE